MADIDVSIGLDADGFDKGIKKVEDGALKATKAMKDTVGQATHAEGAFKGVGNAAGAATQQVNDFITQVAGGQNPLLAMFQQGQQLQGQFGSLEGGIKAITGVLANFTTIGGAVAYLTPVFASLGTIITTLGSIIFSTVGAALAFVGALGYLAYKVYDGIRAFQDFNSAMAMSGQTASLTMDEFNKISSSTKYGRDALEGMAKSGANVSMALGETATVIGKVADSSEQATKMGEELGKAQQDAVGWATQTNKATRFLTEEIMKNIQALQSQGKFVEAGQVAFNAYIAAIGKARIANESKKSSIDEVNSGMYESISLGDFSAQSAAQQAKKTEELTKALNNQERATRELNAEQKENIRLQNEAMAAMFGPQNDVLKTVLDYQDKISKSQTESTRASLIGNDVAKAREATEQKILSVKSQIAQLDTKYANGNKAGRDAEQKALEQQIADIKLRGSIEEQQAARSMQVQAISTSQYSTMLQQRLDGLNKIKQMTIDTAGADRTFVDDKLRKTQAQTEYESQLLDINNKIAQEKVKGTIASANQIKSLEQQKAIVIANYEIIKSLNDAETSKAIILERQRVAVQELTQARISDYAISGDNLKRYDLLRMAQTESVAYELRKVDAAKQYNDAIANSAARLQQLSNNQNDGGNVTNNAQPMIDALKNSYAELYSMQAQGGQATEEMLTRQAELETGIKEMIGEKNAVEAEGLLASMQISAKRHADFMAQQALERQAVIDRNASFTEGAKSGFDQIQKSMTPFQQASDMVTKTWGTMGSAIDNFVRTGKLSFSDLARSIIADIAAMIIKQQIFLAMKAASAATGGFGGLTTMLGFAEGGQPPVNKPSIVGENGPEIFVPKSAGTVLPNGVMPTGGGQSQQPQQVTNTYVTNNISALDSRSVAQLFAENRKQLFGAVETARKEFPGRVRA